jgi:hypothetical protein
MKEKQAKTIFLSKEALNVADKLRKKVAPAPSLCAYLSHQLETILTTKTKQNVKTN